MSAGNFYIETNCCAVQRNETYRIANFFFLNGYNEVSDISDADIIVVTTCGVTNECEKDSFDKISNILSNCSSSAKIIISGCLPNICLAELKESFPNTIIISLDKLEMFNEVIDCDIKIENVTYNHEAKFHHSKGDPRARKGKYDLEHLTSQSLAKKYDNDDFVEAFKYSTQGYYLWKDDSIFEIKISSGCVNECTYCASRLGIGNYKSKPLDQIEKELIVGLSNNKNKIMLMGDELGAYGVDTGKNLIDVIELCLSINPDAKIGIRYIHPDFFVKLFPNLKPYLEKLFFLCVSIQSASKNVLSMMGRNDDISDVRKILSDISMNYKNIFLHTQIIVGFPNETNQDFLDTINFLKEIKFDYIRYNTFSPRKGTKAYDYPIEYGDDDLQYRLKFMKEFCYYNRTERLYTKYKELILRSIN